MAFFIIAGRPDLGTFTITPNPPEIITALQMERAPTPAQEMATVNIGSSHYYPSSADRMLKEAWWKIPSPKDGIFKPHPLSDKFWPATRARYVMKEISPDVGRQTFDKNIRAIAARINVTPEELLKKNPILVGRQIGLSNEKMSKIYGNYYALLNGAW